MLIHSTSKYPEQTVRNLVVFATAHVDTTGVVFIVKNSKFAFAGMAYMGVPNISPFKRDPSNKYLVTVRIGDEKHYPRTNMVVKRVWKKATREEFLAEPSVHRHRVTARGKDVYERCEIQRHPYGGVSSPLIEMNDWKEALIAVAAHEARHIHQFRNRLPASEIDCERFAAETIQRYREAQKLYAT